MALSRVLQIAAGALLLLAPAVSAAAIPTSVVPLAPRPTALRHLSPRSVDEDVWSHIIVPPEEELFFPESKELLLPESEERLSPESEASPSLEKRRHHHVLLPDTSELSSLEPSSISPDDHDDASEALEKRKVDWFMEVTPSVDTTHAYGQDADEYFLGEIEGARSTEERTRIITRMVEQKKLIFMCTKAYIYPRDVQIHVPLANMNSKPEDWWACQDGGWVHIDWYNKRTPGHGFNQLDFAKEEYYSPEMPVWGVNSSVLLPMYHYKHLQDRYGWSRVPIYYCLQVSTHMERPEHGVDRDYMQCDRGCFIRADRFDRGFPSWKDLEEVEAANRDEFNSYRRVPEYNHWWRQCQ